MGYSTRGCKRVGLDLAMKDNNNSSDAEHLVMYLLAIWVSLEKCLFRSSVYFLIWLLIFLYRADEQFVYFED